MRLTCPNCNAQYEVDAAVIPDLGRDVQCSNCGQTWFQAGPLTPAPEKERSIAVIAPQDTPPDADLPAQEALAQSVDSFDGWDTDEATLSPAQPEDDLPESSLEEADQPDDILAETMAPEDAPSEIPPAPVQADAFGTGAFAGRSTLNSEFDEEYEAAPPPPNQAARRSIGNDLLAVLREEAQREVQARKAEGSALETQPDLGLPETRPEPHPVEREARLSGFDEMSDEDAPRAARRDLLPDIEEINSTLRATSDRNQGLENDPALDRGKGSGFGRGFGMAIAVAAVGFLTYLGAPKLAVAVPALAPVLEGYTATVDGGRLWLDAKMNALTHSMRTTSGG